MRRAALVRLTGAALLPLFLGGCLSGVLPEPPPPPLTYDLGPLPDEEPARLGLPFRLENVDAPSWLRVRNIHYRRLDEHPAAFRSYTRNQWIAPAPELFAERLEDLLARAAPESSGEWLSLRLTLAAFEHVYTADGESYVVAQARASYDDFDGRTRSRQFEQRRAAAASVDGATAALPVVAEALLDDVLDWLHGETLDRDR